jgi:sugar O-acyltransferase (sialic acid O-acetyltransferase NeuD family)
MTTPLIVIGAGGFGREALDVVEAINGSSATPEFEVLGVIDSGPSDVNLRRLAARGIAWLGTFDELSSIDSAAVRYLIGIGNPEVRQRVDRDLTSRGFEAATVVHPSASIGSASVIGAGSVVCGGVQLSTNVKLGRHVHVNPNATVGHDTELENHVSINPAAVISGDVVVESGSLIGAGAVVLQGLRVGRASTVGASACVTRDVAVGAVVKGVPAV